MYKRQLTKLFFATIFFFFTSIVAVAQDNSIKGFVYEEATGEPMMFTNVYLKGTTFGGSTNENGYFNINRIPDGHYTLLITSVGYDTISESFSLSKGQSISRKYFLKETSKQLETVTITADKIEARSETKTSVITVTPKTITKIPSVGGQADFAQYLQVVPGVIFTGDQGGQLYIRGGTPIQNRVLLDGMTIYNPFHAIGLFSVFDTDILQEADIFTAGFQAEYGGRTSSVMDVRTRNGNKKRFGGKADLSTFGAKLLLEGPLRKATREKPSAISFITSIKGSYLEKSSRLLYRYANNDGLPYNYLDGYGKITIETGGNNYINLFGFSFNDRVSYPDIARYQWNAWGTGANFLVVPSQSEQVINGTLAFSNYSIGLDEFNEFGRSSGIRDFSFSTDFTYHLDNGTFKYGFDLTGTWVDYDFTNAIGVDCGQETFNSEIALYAKYKWNLKRWIVEPGVRLDNYASQSASSLEPRISAKFLMNDRIRFKMAAGIYSQNLIGTSSDQDVVNLFYGFLSVPEADELSGKKIRNSLQKGQHLVGGVEFDIGKNLTANLEVYFKNFSQLTNTNR